MAPVRPSDAVEVHARAASAQGCIAPAGAWTGQAPGRILTLRVQSTQISGIYGVYI